MTQPIGDFYKALQQAQGQTGKLTLAQFQEAANKAGYVSIFGDMDGQAGISTDEALLFTNDKGELNADTVKAKLDAADTSGGWFFGLGGDGQLSDKEIETMKSDYSKKYQEAYKDNVAKTNTYCDTPPPTKIL